MITLDVKSESASSSPLNISAPTAEESTLSFSELLKGSKDSAKTPQNGVVVLALDEKNASDAKTSAKDTKLNPLLSLLKNEDNLSSDTSLKISDDIPKEIVKGSLELNPKLTQNLTIQEIKTLVADAKEYLKSQILQSDGYIKSEAKDLPKTLKGLATLAQKFDIDVSKITMQEVQSESGTKKENSKDVALKDSIGTLKEQKNTLPIESRIQNQVSKSVTKEEEKPLNRHLANIKEVEKLQTQEKIVVNTKEVEKVQEKVAVNTKEVEKVQEKVAVNTKEVEKVQEKVAVNTKEVEKVQEKVAVNTKEVEKVQTQEKIAVSTKEVEKVQEKVAVNTKDVEKPQEKVAVSTKEIEKPQTVEKSDLQNSKQVAQEKHISVANEIKSAPIFKAQTTSQLTTQQIVQAKQLNSNETAVTQNTTATKSSKSKADDTLQLLLRGEKPAPVGVNLTQDFSVATAKVIAPTATSEASRTLENLLKGEQNSENSATTKVDTQTVSKADNFEVKLNEAKQMIKYLSSDVKTAIEDYKSPFTRIKVQLNPQKLGDVDLTIVQRGKNLHVNLSSNNAAINTLVMNANELRVQLSNSGINNATLNFNNQSDGSNPQQQQHQQNGRDAQREYTHFENEESAEEILSSLEIVVPQYI